jgi:pimeloyl-ACP methyl ester carboxylesterase
VGVIDLDALPAVGVVCFQQPSGLPVLTMALAPAGLEPGDADRQQQWWWRLHSQSLEVLPGGVWRVMATLAGQARHHDQRTRRHRHRVASPLVNTHEEGETMRLPDNPMPSSVPAVDQTLVLSDGRTLGYALWGEPEGTPVLLVGTSPGSRLFCPDLPATVAAGVRLVTVDRPGSGRSDPDPHPGMARWVADTGALVDYLRLERFGLVGWSGGGQFALAMAAGLPERVTSVALAGTPAPAHDDLGDWPPQEIRQLVGLVRKDPQGAVEGIAAANQWYPADPQLPMRLWSAPGDQAVGNLPQVAEAMAVMLREGARQGVAGLVYDVVAGSLDWGFPLGEVGAPVALWYGTLDPVVSPRHGRYYAQRLPHASEVYTRAADHLLAIPLWGDILGSLGLPQGR